MDELIKQQLNKLKIAQLPSYDDDTTEIFIPRLTELSIKENNCYLIELDDSLIDPNADSIVRVNWNNGDVPKYKYYKVDVNKKMAQMIRVNGIAYDNTLKCDICEMWSGWLPVNQIKILEKI